MIISELMKMARRFKMAYSSLFRPIKVFYFLRRVEMFAPVFGLQGEQAAAKIAANVVIIGVLHTVFEIV